MKAAQRQASPALAGVAARQQIRAERSGAARLAPPVPTPKPGVCKLLNHTDYWGEAVVWGTTNKVESAEQCCAQCAAYKPQHEDDIYCNVWVWCGDRIRCQASFRNCWLKHLAHPEATAPTVGPHVPWTSGVISEVDPMEEDPQQVGGGQRRYHVVITAQGTAVHWQSRVHYYWYRKVKAACEAAKGKDCQMGGFTRILHSGVPDDLMGEIPTVVVEPLPDRENLGYVVLNRPFAFVQWLAQADIPEKYVLMSEPDHVWLRPMPNLMAGERMAAFPFFYIEPAKPEFKHITEKFTGPLLRRQAEAISPMGNAPTLMAMRDLRKVAPLWVNVSRAIFDDKEAHEKWGWVLEMYGFTIACHMARIQPARLHIKMMSQPPWDTRLWPSYLLHYTYGMDYTLEGQFTPGKIGAWRFDKRSYAGKPPPRKLGEPPKGMTNELTRHLIHAINEATEAIPGWDVYAATGRATQLWDGTTAAS
ncbi:hypothetical protein WJX81_006347 [Elliptochloris bilobata]|uniref:Hydroxyproline O-arabinosyltransferase-like domain-containing protein n=1 Tax=Elliptochloris bilobata TaxID=381761 RepID=A0AAW1RIB4_9CHLO